MSSLVYKLNTRPYETAMMGIMERPLTSWWRQALTSRLQKAATTKN